MAMLLLNYGAPSYVATYMANYSDPNLDRLVGLAQEVACNGRLSLLRYLLDSGNATGWPRAMLTNAINEGDFEYACRILNKGSLVGVMPFIETPVRFEECPKLAFNSGGAGLECLKLLIAHYQDLEIRNPSSSNDETPLMTACRTARPYATISLLASGADVHDKDKKGTMLS